jgi:DNA-binding NarL/FixJ family response regulator
LQTAIQRVLEGDVFLHRGVVGTAYGDLEKAFLAALDPPIAQAVVAICEKLRELSPRQMEVAERMTWTPAAIAEALHLEVRTVRNYQDAIYERLGLRDAIGDLQKMRREPLIVLAVTLHRMQQGAAS